MSQSNHFHDAQDVLVGGVNSPVRSFQAVGGAPVFIHSGYGAYVRSEEGAQYIDYILSYGPLLGGHANTSVVADLHNAIIKGTTFGAPTVKETRLATMIRDFFPSMQKMRFVNSGTEATMSAIRLARGATKRSLVVKFDGCYHGHVDSLLVSAGSGGLTLGTPSSDGIPHPVAQQTVSLPYNDPHALTRFFREHGSDVAAIIMEPVCGNMGVVLPTVAFLTACREITNEYGALLIFDEVMTGFRAAKHGAQGAYGIQPDLTCLGKVIGGGLPCAAYGGREDVMMHLAPVGSVYQAGTLSGNPLAVTAGMAMMDLITTNGIYDMAERQTTRLVEGFRGLIHRHQAPIHVTHMGTMFTVFFTGQSVECLKDVEQCDMAMFNRYFHHMKDNGVLIPPSQYEANFVSSEHSDAIIDTTLSVFESFLRTVYPVA